MARAEPDSITESQTNAVPSEMGAPNQFGSHRSKIQASDNREFSDTRAEGNSAETTVLVPGTAKAQVRPDLIDLAERAREYAANAKAANTRRAYQQD